MPFVTRPARGGARARRNGRRGTPSPGRRARIGVALLYSLTRATYTLLRANVRAPKPMKTLFPESRVSLRNVSIRTRLVAAFATLTLFVLGLGLA